MHMASRLHDGSQLSRAPVYGGLMVLYSPSVRGSCTILSRLWEDLTVEFQVCRD